MTLLQKTEFARSPAGREADGPMPNGAPKRSFAARLFGYDIFLSFALGSPPRGTHSYASDLARRLRERDFTVFFSEDEAPPGEQLDSTLRSALLHSKTLVVIANRGTLQEPRWVRKEVEEFRQCYPNRPVIPVNIDEALQDPALAESAQEWLGYQGKIWVDESEEAVAAGIVSEQVVQRLATAPMRAKSNVSWRWVVRGVGASLVALAVAAGIAAWQARTNAEEANRQRVSAVNNLNVALARQLAAQSGLLLRQNPDRLPLAVLLALESTGLHPTFEGNQALRAALTLLPRLEWSSEHASAPERGRVRALAFSPDGARLAAAREDGSAELIDVRTRKTIALLEHDATPGVVVEVPGDGIRWKAAGVDAEVIAVAFSADGTMVATGSNNHTARLWDSKSGRELRRLDHGGAVGSVAFHPLRPWLATGSVDGSARIWNLADGSLVRRIEGSDEIRAVAFSPDGRYLAAISTGGCTELVELKSRMTPSRWCLGSAGLGLAFSPDSKRLATANGSQAGVYEIGSGHLLFEGTHLSRLEDGMPEHFRWIDQVAFSPDGQFLATAGRDGTARVWDLANGQEMSRLRHAAPVEAVAFSPDGHQLITASFDGTARLWDLASGDERLRAVHPGGSEVAAFSPQGRLVASGGSAGSIELWRLTSGDQVARIPHGVAVKAVGFDADGKRLGTVDDKGDLRIWSAAGELLGFRRSFYGADRVVFSHDGRFVAVRARNPGVSLLDLGRDMAVVDLPGARSADDIALSPRYLAARDREQGRLIVWDVAGGGKLPVPTTEDLSGLAFDDAGLHLAILHQDSRGKGVIRVWALPELKETGSVAFEEKPLFALAPGGGRLAVTGRERPTDRSPWRFYVDIYDVAGARRVLRIEEDRSLAKMQFGPDGRTLLTVGESDADQARELRVWDTADGKLKTRLRHEDDIDAVRCSAHGDELATRSGGSIWIWDFMSGELLGRVTADAGFNDFRLSPDGRHLLTGGRDGAAVVWSWRPDDLRREACRRLTRNLTMDEWARYLGAIPYRATCPNLPVDAGR